MAQIMLEFGEPKEVVFEKLEVKLYIFVSSRLTHFYFFIYLQKALQLDPNNEDI